MSILETKDLSKSYKGLQVVKKINISVESGQVVGLLGPNGAGKTTSFYMVVGLVRSNSGRILLNGQDISHLPMHSRAKLGIGYLPQEPSIFRKLTIEENLLAVLETDKKLSQQQRSRRVEQLLEEFNIGHKRDTLGISLSGGERRRAEIARAIALKPYFILLDEPFAGIDPISVGDIQQIIDYLRNTGIGIIITDHNVRETLDICDHSYILTEGKVLTEGTAKQILSHQGVRDVYLGSKFKI
ncbi:MAG: LPS export ABC transporter ATP-binding protein [Acidiferrobacterales bacterium]|nr:LPS export ABC transporter ATP-binding protein [Acidiferrobacterales bacterium]